MQSGIQNAIVAPCASASGLYPFTLFFLLASTLLRAPSILPFHTLVSSLSFTAFLAPSLTHILLGLPVTKTSAVAADLPPPLQELSHDRTLIAVALEIRRFPVEQMFFDVAVDPSPPLQLTVVTAIS